jgi:hypothetical protein
MAVVFRFFFFFSLLLLPFFLSSFRSFVIVVPRRATRDCPRTETNARGGGGGKIGW